MRDGTALRASGRADGWRAVARRGLLPLAFGLFGALLILGTLAFQRRSDGLDDAYISYRFAKNLAEGHGLVFNPGERVEGFSNLLYVLMLAPAFKLGIPMGRIHDYSVGLNLAASLGLLALLMSILRRRAGSAAALAGGALLAASPTIWTWNVSGLETIWVVFLQFAAVVAADETARGSRRALVPCVIACAALVLIRADGFVSAFLVAGFLALRGRSREALWTAGAAGGVLAALVAWRMTYYGLPLPNTYYAKVDGPLAVRIRFAVTRILNSRNLWAHAIVVAAASVPVLAAAVRGRTTRVLDAGLVLTLGILAYFFWIGGDVFNERMLVFLVPYAILLLPALVGSLSTSHAAMPRNIGAPRFAPALAIPLLLGAWQIAVPDYGAARLDELIRPLPGRGNASSWRLLGERLAEGDPTRVIAIDAAGKVPFFSQLPTIDMLGLCDAHIGHSPIRGPFFAGHSKFDPDYVLGRRPDLLASTLDEDLRMAFGIGTRWRGEFSPRWLCSRFEQLPAGLAAVVEVTGESEERIRDYLRMGYDYVVMERIAAEE